MSETRERMLRKRASTSGVAQQHAEPENRTARIQRDCVGRRGQVRFEPLLKLAPRQRVVAVDPRLPRQPQPARRANPARALKHRYDEALPGLRRR